jgi:hypothetical protein
VVGGAASITSYARERKVRWVEGPLGFSMPSPPSHKLSYFRYQGGTWWRRPTARIHSEITKQERTLKLLTRLNAFASPPQTEGESMAGEAGESTKRESGRVKCGMAMAWHGMNRYRVQQLAASALGSHMRALYAPRSHRIDFDS